MILTLIDQKNCSQLKVQIGTLEYPSYWEMGAYCEVHLFEYMQGVLVREGVNREIKDRGLNRHKRG